jgi:alkylation response protein AidB-like acyl-CoA dehydrogenase
MGEASTLGSDPLAEELDRFVDGHHLVRRAQELDRAPSFPKSEFRAMGVAGWLGLATPPEAGGRGLPLPRVGSLLFRLAYRTGTVFAKLSLQPEFCSVLREHGSAAQLNEWFQPLSRGERLVGNQITEAGAGSDAQALSADARPEGDTYLLTGRKTEVAFSTEADAAIVYARVPGGSGPGITAFLVPQSLPGVQRTRSEPDLGEHWQGRGTVDYREVRVPTEFRIGDIGAGFEYVRGELTRERALLAAIYLGVGRASWAETVRHVGERIAFDRPLAAQQAVAFPLVEDGARLDAAELFVARTLDRLERGEAAEGDAALSKWMAVEVALSAIDHAIQFHGGRGYSGELPHEQRWRDVRSGAIAHGPSEVMHLVAARELWPRAGRSGASSSRTGTR